MLGAEVQGLQEERGELGLVGGELFLPHHPNVLTQDAHKRAHEILKTQEMCPFLLLLEFINASVMALNNHIL